MANLKLEKYFKNFCFLVSIITISITVFVLAILYLKTANFFEVVPLKNFLFGLNWMPDEGNVKEFAKTSFGVIPLLVGTLLISIISLLFSVPIGVAAAIYIAEYASKNTSFFIKQFMEIIAGIPSIVFGYLAALLLSPWVRKLADFYGLEASSEAALTAGIAIGFMILPYIICLSEEAISSIPISQRDGAFAIGATKFEVITKVLLPGCKSNIYTAIILSFLRSIGETMIVTMVAGISANLTLNPLQSVTTFTVQIVNILNGDQPYDSIQVSSGFAISFLLILICLFCNIFIDRVLRK